MTAALRSLLAVPAPAKLNWFLHVLGRRADGMHELQTVFQFIDWCDEIDFELRDDGEVSREGGDGLAEDDLCVRAARLLQRQAGCRLGVHMRLRKRVPMQAGLGGGSSDAASVLLALNRLWGLGLARAQLQDLALQLGADVPVFVFGRSAFAEGVGARLREIELPRWRVLVAWPGAGVSTAQVFSSPSLTRDTPPCTMEGFREHLKKALCESGDGGRGQAVWAMPECLDFGANDLQTVAMQLLPEIGRLRDWLTGKAGGEPRMSGSGSAMFVPWPHAGDVELDDLPAGWSARVCEALTQHPLLRWASDAGME